MTEVSVTTDTTPDNVAEVTETAEPGPAATPEPDPTRGPDPTSGEASDDTDARAGGMASRLLRRPSRFTVLVAALVAAVIALAVAATLLVQQVRAVDELAGQRAAVLDSARKVATDLTSISAQDAQQRITSLTNETTGGFRGQLSSYGAVIQAIMRLSNAGSRGTVTDAAIDHVDENSATALVTATAEVTSDRTQAARSVSYRMVVQLQRDGDKWLVSDVRFVA